MRAFASLVLAFGAALAVAQNTTQPNAFSIPPNQSTYVVTAGQTINLQWTEKEGSTVTIKLQSNANIQPDSGVVLAQSIANNGQATVQIPASADIPAGTYTFEIINDDDPSQMNFSPFFGISGASGTGSFAPATATSITGSASESTTASASMTTSSGSASTTGSSTSSTTSSDSSAAASSSSTAAASSSASQTSSAAAATTSAPNSNAAWQVQAPFGVAMALAGAAAIL